MPKKKPNLKKERIYPDELLIIENVEKRYHEKWFEGRNKLNFPHPFRLLALGGVNMGKTLWIQNIVARIQPPFRRILLYHCGGEYVKEYQDLDYTCINEIPEPNDEIFNPDIKTLLIIEDKEYKYMSKEELKRLDRAFGYVSTHRGLSVICTGQDFFNLPAPIRRMTNIFILWKTKDIDSLKTIGRRVGLKKEEIQHLIKKYLTSLRDSLWLDGTFNSPYPIRKNGFQLIDKKENNID